MARADTLTMLPLDRFAKILNINPLHFNGVQLADISPPGTCDQPMLQFGWQYADRAGRDEIAQAIAQAEERISRLLGFKPIPQWQQEERGRVAGVGPSGATWGGYGRSGLTGSLDWGYYIAGGFPRSDLVELAATVTYTDGDGDGYDEAATITVTVPVGTLTSEIAVVYPGQDGDAAWEVRPRKVTLDEPGTTATITVRREQLALPDRLEAFGARGLDGLDDDNFLEEVDVYRRVHDPSKQAHVVWPAGGCGCLGDGCEICAVQLQTACLVGSDYRNSLVGLRLGSWDAEAGLFSGAGLCGWWGGEARAKYWYRAGWQDGSAREPMLDMDPSWERAIAYLAVALLDRPMCSCEPLAAISTYWREDLAQSSSSPSFSQSWQIDRSLLGNPLGTSRGALWAWRMVRSHAIGNLGRG